MYDRVGKVEKRDVGLGVGVVCWGDYGEVGVEECLEGVGGEVVEVGIGERGEEGKEEEVG